MKIAKWGKPFRLDSLDPGWEAAPKKAGVYVVYNGKMIPRIGGTDKKGILYIGKSGVLRDRLWNFWYANHPASGFLWTYPIMAKLILKKPCTTSKQIENLLGDFNIVVSTPIPKPMLRQAERAAMHAYYLRYGELPPLNFSFPMKWDEPPKKDLLRWAGGMLD